MPSGQDNYPLFTKHARDANIPETNSDVKLTVKICQGGRCKNDLDDVLDVVIRGLIDANILKNKKQIVEYGANSGFRLGYKQPLVEIKVENLT